MLPGPDKEAVIVHVRPIPQPVSLTFVARLAFGVAVLALAAGTSQAQPAPAPGAAQAAGTYKNVQILKDLSPAQLQDTMVYFAAAMGGNCSSCHVRGADGEFAYEKDDN
jgi:mono/diheme cytochrome c family protein